MALVRFNQVWGVQVRREGQHMMALVPCHQVWGVQVRREGQQVRYEVSKRRLGGFTRNSGHFLSLIQ